MQQTLVGCAFCDAAPGTETGEVHTWGQDERVTHPICVDCAIQTEPDPDERNHVACDGCGLVVDTLAASPAHRAGFQRDLRSRPAHPVPGRTGAPRRPDTAVRLL
ncbi:hypothetical protein SY89_03211 [Halolamina pelagica]|uniref:Uncharacterized protein n=1 Tax=Halolamina pelagica TaxID=699431 RepID=A0A0P7HQL2_9EURY|nr:hypothetical protein SY89_03211 [Halolamina pelagica]